MLGVVKLDRSRAINFVLNKLVTHKKKKKKKTNYQKFKIDQLILYSCKIVLLWEQNAKKKSIKKWLFHHTPLQVCSNFIMCQR